MIAWIFFGFILPVSALLYVIGAVSWDWWKSRQQQAATPQHPGFTTEELAALREIARLDAEAAQR